VTTRGYDERLATLDAARAAGMHLCCGGILGMGEGRADRAELLLAARAVRAAARERPYQRARAGRRTPLASAPRLDWTELVRTVAAARVLMPASVVRLSAGRGELDEAAQALCFLAGANSIFLGDELLTTPNPTPESDAALLAKLGLAPTRA
jgi:biotin synthase